MGFLLKIVIFAVVVYGIWKTANRWFSLLGGRPPEAPPPPAQPQQAPREPASARARAVEDTHPCPACGAYVSVGAGKCGRSDCPQA